LGGSAGCLGGYWCTVAAAAEHNHVIGDYFGAVVFLAVLIFPAACLQVTLDVNLAAFSEILGTNFSEAAPGYDVVKLGGVLFVALLVFPDAIGSQAKIGDGNALGSGAGFGVAGEAADEHNFIEVHTQYINIARQRS